MVEEFDPRNGTWTTKAPMPTLRWGHAVAALNGLLYVIRGGGTYAIDVFDPAANTWLTNQVPPIPYGPANGFPFMGAISTHGGAPDSLIIAGGGDSYGPLPNTIIYTPSPN